MITWEIDNLEVKPTEGDRTNVVITVDWRCIGTDGPHSQNAFGGVNVVNVDEDGNVVLSGQFTEFDNLTKDQVLSWCWQKVNKDFVEETVSAKLEAVKKQALVSMSLPE